MKLTRALPILLWRFRKELRMVWEMLKTPAAPKKAKLVALAAVVYVISPIDLVPDIAPILGWLDDAAILAGLFTLSLKMLPKDVYAQLRQKVYGDAAHVEPGAPPAGARADPSRGGGRIIDVEPIKS